MNAGGRPLDVVVGTGSWGTTLAIVLARRQHAVTLLARTAEEAERLRYDGENRRFLPGVPFPASLTAGADPSVLAEARSVTIAVPSETLTAAVQLLAGRIGPTAVVVSASKGLVAESHRRLSEVIAAAVPNPVCVLSGPNLAREIARELPASTVIASDDPEAALAVQGILAGHTLRVYTSSDVVGVELGGALKNIIALAAGASDGLNLGDNAKAALMTRGLAEITRLGTALGAQARTFAGLAGLGDLVATCASPLSRNRRLGERLARGESWQQAQRELGQVAEGVPTTRAAVALSRSVGVEMPIAEQMHAVLFEGQDPRAAVLELMRREPKGE
ncbi:MAG: NAD(P)-dependent glycerol-3-phosphate dehydrogenase [Chloroflexota bacterium]|nr:NAD(P)-dependent glycerol-3-phosphate dehydrogenase [Chloroflexota bacterium]